MQCHIFFLNLSMKRGDDPLIICGREGRERWRGGDVWLHTQWRRITDFVSCVIIQGLIPVDVETESG